MAIGIIYGPGGSGKSFFQMLIVVKQLRETRRNICTNLSIKVPELQAWLERNYPDECIDAGARIRLLTEAETREFWRYRGPIKWLGTDAATVYDGVVDEGVNGVCYIIDEAGAAGFDALGWASSDGRTSRGTKAIWYLDQQRKFGDDVFASTNGRSPGQIAKPFRDKAHKFIRLRNEYLATYGPFKGRGRFVWKEYGQEPTGSNKVEPVQRGTFCYGTGLEDCYKTEQGVGVIGAKADKGAKAKGIPIMWVIPMALALSSLCFLVPYALGKIGGAVISKTATAEGERAAAAVAGSAGAGHVDEGGGVHQANPGSDGVQAAARRQKGATYLSAANGVTIVRYYVDGYTARVELSDGSILDHDSPRLGAIGPNWVMIDGERIAWRAAPSEFYQPPPPAPGLAPSAPSSVGQPVAMPEEIAALAPGPG